MNLEAERASSAPIIEIADSLAQRAWRHRIEAYLLLFGMIALVVVASFVFLHAKDIAMRDTEQDTETKKSDIVTKYKQDAADTKTAEEELSNNILRYIQPLLGRIGGKVGRFGGVGGCQMKITSDTNEYMYRPLGDILDAIKEAEARPQGCSLKKSDKETYSVFQLYHSSSVKEYDWSNTEQWSGGFLAFSYERQMLDKLEKDKEFEDLSKEAALTLDSKETEKLIRRASQFQRATTVDAAAYSKIKETIRNGEIDKLAGTQKDSSLSIPMLVQVNIVRFGAIALVLIIINIMLPMHRFAATLSTFYQSRADALRLHQVAYSDMKLNEIVSALAPANEVGSSPVIPERVLDIIKAASGHTGM